MDKGNQDRKEGFLTVFDAFDEKEESKAKACKQCPKITTPLCSCFFLFFVPIFFMREVLTF